MIIFQESGRLGNQLFQYVALKTLYPNSKELILLGFNSLKSAFDGLEAKIIDSQSSRFERILYSRFYRFMNLLSQLRIFTRAKEKKNLAELHYNHGIFKKHIFVEESYFQNESFFNPEVVNSLTLKPKLLEFSQNLLKKIACGKTPVFIHIRRGDYLTWPDQASPAVLPASYYHKCIKLLKAKISNPFFIFVSDDFYYAKDIFGSLENSYISQGSELEDFALMTQCHAGILSASSFSWWGAYMANSKHQNGCFLAPDKWCGHRLGQWFPILSEPSPSKTCFLTYINTKPD